MKRTLFFLGRTPKLAFLELQSLYPSVTLLLPDVAVISAPVDIAECIRRLGGTVKIAKEVDTVSELTVETLATIFQRYVIEGKLAFGISVYGNTETAPPQARAIKKYFLDRGVRVRYAEPEHGETLSSVVITKQNITEVNIVGTDIGYLLSVTHAVQDFEDWNKRDAARPAPDVKHGMLPPKVARMIVNIGLGSETHNKILLDPFCGVGTIPAEALLTGADVIGLDTSKDAVARATKNIAWLRAEYGLLHSDNSTLVIGDATHVSEYVKEGSVDAIATEPFMGSLVTDRMKDTLSPLQIKNTLKGLEKLYIGCLKDWYSVLRTGGKIVMAMPLYHIDGRNFSVKNVVDRCEIYGYTLLTGPIEYSRPQAVVRREFYIFQKK